ncbi:MAG: glutathione peroxidase [Verrucomicrobia bacterium]|nr:glutathione peroxidase [Prolixibacteraceae bacterium]
MRKITIILSLLVITTVAFGQKSFYDFKVTDIDGKEFDLSSLKGKKVLVVNTASKCGYTPQYEQLESIYKNYGDEKFTVIAFPANNFNNQEPGSDAEVEEFCKKNYGVSFPIMSKISVKGNDMHPLYRWLTSKNENGVMDSEVKWNFQKYLIDEDGKLVEVFESKVKPDDEKIVGWIKK